MAGLLMAAVAGCGGGNNARPKTPTVGNRTPILSHIANDVEPDPALESTQIVLPAPRRNSNWAQAGGTASNVVGHLELAAAPQRVWTVRIPGSSKKRRLASAPVVGDGKMFVIDTDGVVHAFDAKTGATLWTHRIEVADDLEDVAFGGGASYDEGRVYATNGAGDVVALNAQDGSQIWKVKPAGPLRGAPTVAFNAVYVMTQDNQIQALNSSDGSILWQEAAAMSQSGVFGVAAPAAGQATVIAGYSSGELVAYRYENGRSLWSDALARTSISTQVGTLTDVDADPIIDNGTVYALGQGGRMAAYELITGQRLWELSLAGISTPAVAGEWIFTLTSDSRLLAIARSTGRIRWITQLQRWQNEKKRTGPVFWVGPVLAGNKLWIASSEGEVKTVDVQTGTASDFGDIGEAVSLGPIVADGTLYILDDSGRITAWR
ncbi:outer membrane protein assembly factor BamB family protein [Altererythrobacter sp. B11]|uniref:outer membrane protein assembly factor BamB family protein n=1 Tax=Altererythrobacter sp. B11 TaxID=2060312 RepID=UPI001E421CC6|nr:PQQ-binding-like beta-propeller repeat protein [Altererythrobacter sp. B11]